MQAGSNTNNALGTQSEINKGRNTTPMLTGTDVILVVDIGTYTY